MSKGVYFRITPIVLGNIKIKVTAQSAQAADALERDLLVEVSFNTSTEI